MNNVVGFFHIGVIGRWFEIYKSQINRLKSSGLYDITDKIYIGISGNDVSNILELNNKTEVICLEPRLEYGETTTIKTLHKFCQNNATKLWYIHTKGAHYTEHCKPHMIENIDSWRNYLEYFIIDHHKKCKNNLDYYDICGTEYSDKHFFSGNFWWANSNYIKTINLIGIWLTGYTLGTWKSTRHLAERQFIGTANPRIFNFMNIYKDSRDAYFAKIDPSQYMKVLNDI